MPFSIDFVEILRTAALEGQISAATEKLGTARCYFACSVEIDESRFFWQSFALKDIRAGQQWVVDTSYSSCDCLYADTYALVTRFSTSHNLSTDVSAVVIRCWWLGVWRVSAHRESHPQAQSNEWNIISSIMGFVLFPPSCLISERWGGGVISAKGRFTCQQSSTFLFLFRVLCLFSLPLCSPFY